MANTPSTAEDVSEGTEVKYKHVEYEHPLPDYEFAEQKQDAGGTEKPKPPPPSESRRPICSSLVVKASCMMGGFVTLAVGVGITFGISSPTVGLAAGIPVIGVGGLAIAGGNLWRA